MKRKDEREHQFIISLISNGDFGFMVKSLVFSPEPTEDLKNRFIEWNLIEAILYGSLAQISWRAIDPDALLTHMLRERTKYFLDLLPYEDPYKLTQLLKKFLEKNRGSKGNIPKILSRYCTGDNTSFTNYILDMNTSIHEIQELIAEYNFLGFHN